MNKTERKFAYFGKGQPYYCMDSIPSGGMCLSVFLILSKGNKRNVLMGKLNPGYENWSHIGALDEARLQRHSQGWSLPSRQLVLLEPPQDAARTVLREQLGLDEVELDGPKVFTEVYDIERAGLKNHWDFEFVFFGKLDRNIQPHPAWSELKFVEVSSLPDAEFARNHQDILTNAGVKPARSLDTS